MNDHKASPAQALWLCWVCALPTWIPWSACLICFDAFKPNDIHRPLVFRSLRPVHVDCWQNVPHVFAPGRGAQKSLDIKRTCPRSVKSLKRHFCESRVLFATANRQACVPIPVALAKSCPLWKARASMAVRIELSWDKGEQVLQSDGSVTNVIIVTNLGARYATEYS